MESLNTINYRINSCKKICVSVKVKDFLVRCDFVKWCSNYKI